MTPLFKYVSLLYALCSFKNFQKNHQSFLKTWQNYYEKALEEGLISSKFTHLHSVFSRKKQKTLSGAYDQFSTLKQPPGVALKNKDGKFKKFSKVNT